MKLSISRAWDETVAFLKSDFGSLFILAFALVALPGVILQALGGPAAGTTPAEMPEPGLWMLLLPVVAVLSVIGTLAIAVLAVGRERVIGTALSVALRRFLPLLGATLLLILGAALLFIPLILIGGVGGAGGAGVAVLFLFVLMIAFLFIWVRLMLMTPVAAAEDLGPIGIIRRSWELTSGRFWKLLGFVLLVGLVFIVLSMAVGAVAGILIFALLGEPEPGSFASFLILLLTGVVNAVVALVFTAMLARIYLQLAPRTAEVFD